MYANIFNQEQNCFLAKLYLFKLFFNMFYANQTILTRNMSRPGRCRHFFGGAVTSMPLPLIFSAAGRRHLNC